MCIYKRTNKTYSSQSHLLYIAKIRPRKETRKGDKKPLFKVKQVKETGRKNKKGKRKGSTIDTIEHYVKSFRLK